MNSDRSRGTRTLTDEQITSERSVGRRRLMLGAGASVAATVAAAVVADRAGAQQRRNDNDTGHWRRWAPAQPPVWFEGDPKRAQPYTGLTDFDRGTDAPLHGTRGMLEQRRWMQQELQRQEEQERRARRPQFDNDTEQWGHGPWGRTYSPGDPKPRPAPPPQARPAPTRPNPTGPAPGRVTGITDTDAGPHADPARNGRGGARTVQPAPRPQPLPNPAAQSQACTQGCAAQRQRCLAPGQAWLPQCNHEYQICTTRC